MSSYFVWMLQSLFKFKGSFKYEVAICCIAKNEEPYLGEWVDYHLKIGVSRFYIYDNGSDTPISSTLSNYITQGIVKVEVVKGEHKQRHAYKQCLANHGTECQWIAFLDVDEFLVPKTLTGNLPEFLRSYEKFGGLGVNWLVFGSNGQVKPPKGTQIKSYTRRSLKTEPINTHIKSIVQPRHVKRVPADPHHFIYKLGKFCVNENFERITGPRVTHTSNKMQINHYFLRSFEEFKQKLERGRADGGEVRKIDDFYALDENANLIADEYILELTLILDKKNDLTTMSKTVLNR